MENIIKTTQLEKNLDKFSELIKVLYYFDKIIDTELYNKLRDVIEKGYKNIYIKRKEILKNSFKPISKDCNCDEDNYEDDENY